MVQRLRVRGRCYDVQPRRCELTHLYRNIALLQRVDCEVIVTIGTVKKLANDQSPMARRDVGRAGS